MRSMIEAGLLTTGAMSPASSNRPDRFPPRRKLKLASEKILYATFDCLPAMTGRSTRSLQFLEALRSDFECHCVCLQGEAQPLVEELDGIHFRRVMTEGLTLSESIVVYAQTVCSELDRLSARIVQVTDPFSARVLCALKGGGAFKLIYEATGLPSFEFEAIWPDWSDEFDSALEQRLRRALRWQERGCLQKVDAVLVGSATTAKLLHTWGIGQDAITVLPTSADVSLPVPDRTRREGAPLELFFEGAFSSWQGLDTLLEGISLAAARVPMHLTMMGNARPRAFMESLRQRIEALSLARAVTLIEPLSGRARADLLRDVDVGVVPLDDCPRNVEQGAPLSKVATYLAAGLPVVASDLPMTRELLDERCALFFEPGNAASLAERLINLALDKERRVALGLAGRQQAEEGLSSLRTKGVLTMLCEDLLGSLGLAASVQSPAMPDIDSANEWIAASARQEASAPHSEGSGAEALELEADDADVEEIEELDEESIEEVMSDASRQETSSSPAATDDQPAFQVMDAAAPPDAAATIAPEGEPDELEDADALLEEAIETEAAATKGSVSFVDGERADAADGSAAQVMELDDLLEQAIDAQTEAVSPARHGMRDGDTAASNELLMELRDCLSGQRAASPESGVQPAEEWLGHVLLGYAPFAVAFGDQGPSASVEFSPVPRNH